MLVQISSAQRLRNRSEPGPSRLNEALEALLGGALHAAATATGADWVSVCIDERHFESGGPSLRHLRLHGRQNGSPRRTLEEGLLPGCRHCTFFGDGGGRPVSCPRPAVEVEGLLPCGSNVAVPMGWGSAARTLGVLSLRTSSDDRETWIAAAARIGRQLRRYDVARRLWLRLGEELLLLGNTGPLEPVDDFILRASQVTIPALVLGEAGVEKDFVAAALHFAAPWWKRPFVHLDCSRLHPPEASDRLRTLLRAASGGTLYLDGIDGLEAALQPALSTLLEAELGISPRGVDEPAARLVVSSRRDPGRLVAAGAFHPALHAQIDWVAVTLPPLRQRRADLPALIRYFFTRHGRADLRLSGKVSRVFATYGWPGNVAELDRVAARLAVMVGRDVVRRKDLALHAPELLADVPSRSLRSASPAPDAPAVEGLVQELLAARFERLRSFHPSLRKALRHIAEHPEEAISLRGLAARACVSPSHLSQLFRSNLGVSFKPFLTLCRVERAQRLLAADPHVAITTVADATGFGDLSQLERAFKRVLGCTPRAFRRSRRS